MRTPTWMEAIRGLGLGDAMARLRRAKRDGFSEGLARAEVDALLAEARARLRGLR